MSFLDEMYKIFIKNERDFDVFVLDMHNWMQFQSEVRGDAIRSSYNNGEYLFCGRHVFFTKIPSYSGINIMKNVVIK